MSPAFKYAAGVVASLVLLAFYLAIVAVGEGRAAASRQFAQDWPFLLFLMPSFGLVIGLVVHAREAAARHATAMAGTSTGLSATAVVACCAHLLPTLLPVLGISAAASLLAAWKEPLLVVAIATNVAVAAYIVRHVRRMKAMESRAGVGQASSRAAIAPTGSGAQVASHRDPVCGMEVQEGSQAASLRHRGKEYHFCSTACKARFEAAPRRYA